MPTSARTVFSLIALAALAAGPGALHAQSRPEPAATIDWMVMDLPPAQMPADGRLGDGYVDVLMKMIFAEMPQARHRILITSVARTWAIPAQGAPMCFTTALITPERERIAYMTPLQLVPPLQVVARSAILTRMPMNDKGEVLAEVLFNRPDLNGLIIPRRSYSAVLDELLAKRLPGSGIDEVTAAGSGSNLLQMIGMGRADYTLEYDYVLKYQQQRFPGTMGTEDLHALPIAGSQPLPSGIACPRTEWGRQMIIRLDAIIARISQRPEYQRSQQRWLPAQTLQRYSKAYSEFYRRRAQPTDPAKFPPAAAAN